LDDHPILSSDGDVPHARVATSDVGWDHGRLRDRSKVILLTEPPRRISLGARPIARGGQAVMVAVDEDDHLVAKLYYEPSGEIVRRLVAILALVARGDLAFGEHAGRFRFAWPVALVADPEAGEILGFAMRRFDVRDDLPIAALFSGRLRTRLFPGADWRLVLTLARNLSALMASLHEHGVLVGDVSHRNLLANRSGVLTLLDCDSLQFTDPRSGEHFPSPVVTPEYAAPEVQLQPQAAPTVAGDRFGLAVLVCRLLLLGDHPFMGFPPGAEEDTDIPHNIRLGATYVLAECDVEVPVGVLDKALLPPEVARLAHAAFAEGHMDPEHRPTAREWVDALDDSIDAVVECSLHRRHAFPGHLSRCPWCARREAGFPDAFGLHLRDTAPLDRGSGRTWRR
jgi:DNA-binding helix-hairpin-helix protein with protein kinase domain